VRTSGLDDAGGMGVEREALSRVGLRGAPHRKDPRRPDRKRLENSSLRAGRLMGRLRDSKPLAKAECFFCGQNVRRGAYWIGNGSEVSHLTVCEGADCRRSLLGLLIDANEDAIERPYESTDPNVILRNLTNELHAEYWRKRFMWVRYEKGEH